MCLPAAFQVDIDFCGILNSSHVRRDLWKLGHRSARGQIVMELDLYHLEEWSTVLFHVLLNDVVRIVKLMKW